MATFFDILESISTGKDVEMTDELLKEYNPFQINVGLSQHMDTVLFANEMNKMPHLHPHLQYQFLRHAVTKKKRYGKWAKADVLDNQKDIDAISEVYDVSNEKAKEYVRLLNEDQIKEIHKRLDMGGTKEKGKK